MPTLALLTWPLITLIIFRIWATRQAIIVSLFTGYLFLPSAFVVDLPILPPFDKGFMTSVSILGALFIFGSDAGKTGRRQNSQESDKVIVDTTFKILIVGLASLVVFNMVLTVATNREPLFFGPLVLPGLRPWDMLGVLSQLLVWTVPFFIGRQLFYRPEDHRLLLKALVVFGLIYAVFILIEIRLSPQFHNWVYGFHQHSFEQHIRDGVFRPKVFVEHGLAVGIFLFMAFFAAITLWRVSDAKGAAKWLFTGVFFCALLVVSKNLGALIIAILSLGFLFITLRMQLHVITTVCVLLLLFPAARQADIVPTDWAVTQAEAISVERSESLDFRFVNEDILLAKAAEKPLSGWGGWGRSRLYDENGKDLTVTDGLWIIILGTSGWFGYIGFFGMLTVPLLFLSRTSKRKPVMHETSVLAIIVTGALIYIIPNATLNPMSWLIAGALAGFVQYDNAATPEDKPDDDVRGRRRVAYTRFPVK